MKRTYPKLLKKLTIQKISKMRDLYRAGYSGNRLANMFDVNITTVDWHIGELKRPEFIETN